MKQCFFSQNNIKYVDYKDIELLKKFLNPHARVQGKKKTNVRAKKPKTTRSSYKESKIYGTFALCS